MWKLKCWRCNVFSANDKPVKGVGFWHGWSMLKASTHGWFTTKKGQFPKFDRPLIWGLSWWWLEVWNVQIQMRTGQRPYVDQRKTHCSVQLRPGRKHLADPRHARFQRQKTSRGLVKTDRCRSWLWGAQVPVRWFASLLRHCQRSLPGNRGRDDSPSGRLDEVISSFFVKVFVGALHAIDRKDEMKRAASVSIDPTQLSHFERHAPSHATLCKVQVPYYDYGVLAHCRCLSGILRQTNRHPGHWVPQDATRRYKHCTLPISSPRTPHVSRMTPPCFFMFFLPQENWAKMKTAG